MDRDGRLVEFSFSSRLSPGQSSTDLIQLARQVWRNNTRAGLTGQLRRRGVDLDQTVEGPSALILPLSAKILTDHRHGEIVIRVFGGIARRRHRCWAVEGFDQPPVRHGALLDGDIRRLGVADSRRPDGPGLAAAAP